MLAIDTVRMILAKMCFLSHKAGVLGGRPDIFKERFKQFSG